MRCRSTATRPGCVETENALVLIVQRDDLVYAVVGPPDGRLVQTVAAKLPVTALTVADRPARRRGPGAARLVRPRLTHLDRDHTGPKDSEVTGPRAGHSLAWWGWDASLGGRSADRQRRCGAASGCAGAHVRRFRPRHRGRCGCRGRIRGTRSRTGQLAQILRARSTPTPSLGKKIAGGLSRQSPSAIHNVSVSIRSINPPSRATRSSPVDEVSTYPSANWFPSCAVSIL